MEVSLDIIAARNQIVQNFHDQLSLFSHDLTIGKIRRVEYDIRVGIQKNLMIEEIVRLFQTMTCEEQLAFYPLQSSWVQDTLDNYLTDIQRTALVIMS